MPSEQKFKGYGVSACATCDGFFYRGKEVIVVGGGNTAVEEALFLTNFASKVTRGASARQLPRREDPAGPAVQEPEDSVIWDTVLEEVVGGENPLKVQRRRSAQRQDRRRERARRPTACSSPSATRPASELFVGQVEMKPSGYIKTAPFSTATSVPGVFAAGDVTDDVYRQAVTAAGLGCMAALEAERFLAAQGEAEPAVAAE